MSDPSNSVAATNAPTAVSSPKNNYLKYALGGCGCVTLLILAVVGVFVAMVGVGVGDTISKVADQVEKDEEARQVAVEFLEHLEEGQNRKAYALTTKKFREATTVEEVESWASDVRKFGEVKPRHFVAVEKDVLRRNGKSEPYQVVHFEYRKGRERDVIRCPVKVIERTSSDDTSPGKYAPRGLEVLHVDCVRAHVAYRKAWGDNPPKGYKDKDERVVTGWKKYKQPKLDMQAAPAAGAKLRRHLLEGEYAKVRDFFPRAHRKDFGEAAAAKLAEIVRTHGLRKTEFSEWSNMNVLDAWLASGVGKSTYEVRLINPTARSGTRLVLALTRDHDFNKPQGQRAGPFYVTNIEIKKGGRAHK
ncbi:MAG: hypothetical protein ACLFVJ_14015 [Persicimonas sp.]